MDVCLLALHSPFFSRKMCIGNENRQHEKASAVSAEVAVTTTTAVAASIVL